jgi:hypothetical protein
MGLLPGHHANSTNQKIEKKKQRGNNPVDGAPPVGLRREQSIEPSVVCPSAAIKGLY